MGNIAGQRRNETYPVRIPAAAPPPPGDSCPPLDRVFYVGTTTPVTTTPDGSQCAPYPTLAEGIAAAGAILADIAPIVGIIVANGDYTAEGVLALPFDGKSYFFDSIGGLFFASFSIDAAAVATSTSYSFHNLTSNTSLPISNGVNGSAVHLSFSADRGDDGGRTGSPLAAYPGIDDTAFTGSQIKVTMQGGRCDADWNAAVATDVNAWGTLLGYVQGDFNFNMSVHSFEQMDTCHVIDARLTAAAAPTATPTSTGGLCGWTAGMFSGSCTFTGPAASFLVDDLSLWTFLTAGGVVAEATISQLNYPGTVVGDFDTDLPATAPNGARFVSRVDGVVEFIYDSNGTGAQAWCPYIDGHIGVRIPVVASWTALGAGGTFTNVSGAIAGNQTSAAGRNVVALVRAAAGASTQTLHVRMAGVTIGAAPSQDGGSYAGIVLAEANPGTKLTTFGIGTDSDGNIGSRFISVIDWTDPTTRSASVYSEIVSSDARWLRVVDDNANVSFQISCDGVNWQEVFTRASGAFLTKTRAGIATVRNSTGAFPVDATFDSWDE